MSDLNQYAISRILGSTMKHTKRPAFGPLGQLHSQNQILAQRPRRDEQITLAPGSEKLIIRAFEETRKGLPLERVLADPALIAKLLKRAKQLGVKAQDRVILLRLFRLRKAPKARHRLAEPTVKEPKRDYDAFAFAAEMASSQMRYRYGASVDDILAYPEIGREYDALCQKIFPGPSVIDYRMAALNVRKRRYCNSSERTLFDSLRESKADAAATSPGCLSRVKLESLRGVQGIVGLVEETHRTRFIYLTGSDDIGETLIPFTRESTLRAIGNSFWAPSLQTIRVLIYDAPNKLRNAPQSLWVKRLISIKSPIFNHPIRISERSAA